MIDHLRLPMFPLGSVLFPHTVVPLRVFERRYRELLDTALATDGRFGTVLIERGFEVGGDDARFDTGTLVEVVGVNDLDNGDRVIAVAGLERIQVMEWLPDDPHPWAAVTPNPDSKSTLPIRVEAARTALQSVLALASEMGADVGGVDLDVSEDEQAASQQLCAIAPLQPIDQLGLLNAEDASARVERLIELLDEKAELLRLHLAAG